MTYISYNNVNRPREYYGHERSQMKNIQTKLFHLYGTLKQTNQVHSNRNQIKKKYTGEAINEKT